MKNKGILSGVISLAAGAAGLFILNKYKMLDFSLKEEIKDEFLTKKEKVMNNELKEKLLKVCEQVSADVENDVHDFEGKSFNGRTIATYFGCQAAAIKALSNVLKRLIEEQGVSDR